MNKHFSGIFIFLLIANAIHAQEEISQKDTLSTNVQVTSTTPRPRPMPAVARSFIRFIRILLAILANDDIQNNAKVMNNLLTSLLQTAYQVTQATKPIIPKQKRFASQETDALIMELAQLITQEAQAISVNRIPAQSGKKQNGMDEDTKLILANFAGIAAHFINILQDPENREVVPEEIKGMLTGIVDIGNIVMRSSALKYDSVADYEQLKSYAKELDPEMKKHIYQVILSARDKSGLSIS